MTIQDGIELFRTHQRSQARQKTRESYAYLLRNLETLFGEKAMDATSTEDIHQFLLSVTSSRARSGARLRYAQVKALFSFMIEHGKIASNPCDDPVLRKTFRAHMRQQMARYNLHINATIPAEDAGVLDAKDRFLSSGGQWKPTPVLEARLRDAALGKVKCHRV